MPSIVRVAFPLVLQSPVSGSALVGAKATVTHHVVGGALGSGEPAEIFLTETEAAKVAGNTIVTDNTGRWTQGEGASPAYAQYWLPEDRYDILISGTGLKSVYITRELVAAFPVGLWTNLTLGVKVQPGALQIPGARIEPGSVARLRGIPTVIIGEELITGQTIATIPVGVRPPATVKFPSYRNGNENLPVTITVTAAGVITSNVTTNSQQIIALLDGVTYNLT